MVLDLKLYITVEQGNPAANHFGRAYRHVYQNAAGNGDGNNPPQGAQV
jgi:hypothetical protein